MDDMNAKIIVGKIIAEHQQKTGFIFGAGAVSLMEQIASEAWQAATEQAGQPSAGYKLVPIEPTLDMYYAACKAYCAWEVQCAEEVRAGKEFSQPNFTHSDAYRAMIAAAPENATKVRI